MVVVQEDWNYSEENAEHRGGHVMLLGELQVGTPGPPMAFQESLDPSCLLVCKATGHAWMDWCPATLVADLD